MSTHAHDNAGHGTVASYTVGFVLSIVLTLLSFSVVLWLKSSFAGSEPTWLVVFCIAQLLVQVIFFLHLGKAHSQNTAIFIFTVVLVLIAVGGSLAVMYNANHNMMG